MTDRLTAAQMHRAAALILAALNDEDRAAMAACGRPGQPAAEPETWRWHCAHDDTLLDPGLAIAGNQEILYHPGDGTRSGCGSYSAGLYSDQQYPAMGGRGLCNLALTDVQDLTPQVARHIQRHDPAATVAATAAWRDLLAAAMPMAGRADDAGGLADAVVRAAAACGVAAL
jgi:hypothetical protein